MILLDTHALVWWLSDPDKLSQEARKVIDEARVQEAVYVSSISVWEIALLVERGRLKLDRSPRQWLSQAQSLPYLSFLPVTNAVALESVYLPEPFHSDPADRLIAATARLYEYRLISRDRRILDYPEVEALW